MAVRTLFEVERSLLKMRAARTQLVPLSMDNSSPSDMAFQIGLRNVFLSGLRTIRLSLGRQLKRGSLENRIAIAASRKRRRRRGSGEVGYDLLRATHRRSRT
jgi:hypothetical protein